MWALARALLRRAAVTNTLAELIDRLDELDDSLSIYAEPRWRPSSAAALLDEARAAAPPGTTFLIGVANAKRVARLRAAWAPGRPLSLAEKCEAIVYFAIYDEVQPPPSVYGERGRGSYPGEAA